MILLVERAQPIGWMAPAREILQSAAQQGIRRQDRRSAPAPSEGIASHHPGGAQFGLRNGAVAFLQGTMYDGDFRQMLRGTLEAKYRWY